MSLINIIDVIKEFADKEPGKPLITVDRNSITYEMFIEKVNAVARALGAAGIKKNQKIGMILPNSTEWYQIFWGIVKTGAQPVPLDPQIGGWEMYHLLSLLEIETCFIASRYRANNIKDNILKVRPELPALKTLVSLDGEEAGIIGMEQFLQNSASFPEFEPGEDHALMLACTSGSTGNPKILVVPYQGFYAAQRDMARYLDFKPRDVMLLGMPLYHQGGFGMGLQMVISGGSLIYQPSFDPDCFLRTVEEKKVTIVQLTATLAKILLSNPDLEKYDLSSLRLCYFAGEKLPCELARRFYGDLGVRVINIIGSSETASMVVWDSAYDRDVDVNDFRALPFTEFKILGEHFKEVELMERGTIFIRTDALIKEYYKNAEETALRIHTINKQIWFNTGDLGIKLPGDRVRFAGRSKRIIKRGANLIYPEEIEAFLLTHPEIEAVGVIGQNHELIGETSVAYIQPSKNNIITRGDIIKFCKGKLAAYKIPDKVICADAIPHDIGKIQYKYLRKELNGNDS